MVYPTRSDLKHQYPRRTDVGRLRNVLDELCYKSLASDRVAEEDAVRQVRPGSIKNRVVHLLRSMVTPIKDDNTMNVKLLRADAPMGDGTSRADTRKTVAIIHLPARY